MHNPVVGGASRVSPIPGSPPLFKKVYGEKYAEPMDNVDVLAYAQVADAIAAYEESSELHPFVEV